MYLSYSGQIAISETNMNKINNSANMKVSSGNPATAHTLGSCSQYIEKESKLLNIATKQCHS